mmetsp:Transcript_18312/g.44066  ORF Transcript_18312/g.44066 Transcript_18312/m.44066 type:complete len:246 (+) Transcript_18312:72-809(+)
MFCFHFCNSCNFCSNIWEYSFHETFFFGEELVDDFAAGSSSSSLPKIDLTREDAPHPQLLSPSRLGLRKPSEAGSASGSSSAPIISLAASAALSAALAACVPAAAAPAAAPDAARRKVSVQPHPESPSFFTGIGPPSVELPPWVETSVSFACCMFSSWSTSGSSSKGILGSSCARAFFHTVLQAEHCEPLSSIHTAALRSTPSDVDSNIVPTKHNGCPINPEQISTVLRSPQGTCHLWPGNDFFK